MEPQKQMNTVDNAVKNKQKAHRNKTEGFKILRNKKKISVLEDEKGVEDKQTGLVTL